jgi:hypothetical protein
VQETDPYRQRSQAITLLGTVTDMLKLSTNLLEEYDYNYLIKKDLGLRAEL